MARPGEVLRPIWANLLAVLLLIPLGLILLTDWIVMKLVRRRGGLDR